jgi:hypothetical protein
MLPDSLIRFGLVPAPEHLPEIRQMIAALAANANRNGNEDLKTLCIQLFSAADPRDALLIYRAKESSFDAACYIDIQLTCGAGLEATQAYLASCGEPQAADLLQRLKDGVGFNEFQDFTPERQLDFYRQYYGLPEAGSNGR